ncbi:MAG: coproporphyrinogen III oxidase, partial [Rhodoferax sp.]
MIAPGISIVETVRAYLLGLQESITTRIVAIDGTSFLTDAWEKQAGEPLQGSGITQILENGPVFERAGCGFSHVTGPRLPPSATQRRPELAGAPFEAL